MTRKNRDFMDKFIVYLTVNRINGKVYVGVHTTTEPYKFDGYLGCGVWIRKNGGKFHNPKQAFHRAFNKYGAEAFTRHTLIVCDTMEEALEYEKKIVTEDFVKSNKTYNPVIGGKGVTIASQKPVHQYSIDGKYLKTFKSISEAGRKVSPDNPKSGFAAISAVINNGKPTAFGYRWDVKKKRYLPKLKKAKRVYMFSEDGELLREFDSAHKANDYMTTKY